jgi:hypothetical protein
MTEIGLQGSGIDTLVGQGIAAGMPEHVGMDGKAEAGGLTGPLDKPLKSLPSAVIALRSCGRSERAPLCFSEKTLLAPAVFNTAIWSPSVRPSVETRE